VAVALVVAFLVVPAVELYVIVQVGQQIGAGWTVVLLLAVSVAGGWLVRREGGRAWTALRAAVNAGRLPDRELADGALVLVGGALLLTPGFCTDVVGLALVLPVTRPLARRVLAALVARRARRAAARTGRAGPGRVVSGEVVDPPGGHSDRP
jgi:UPF0716 protein FxsA